jgi:hypothetical protein
MFKLETIIHLQFFSKDVFLFLSVSLPVDRCILDLENSNIFFILLPIVQKQILLLQSNLNIIQTYFSTSCIFHLIFHAEALSMKIISTIFILTTNR